MIELWDVGVPQFLLLYHEQPVLSVTVESRSQELSVFLDLLKC